MNIIEDLLFDNRWRCNWQFCGILGKKAGQQEHASNCGGQRPNLQDGLHGVVGWWFEATILTGGEHRDVAVRCRVPGQHKQVPARRGRSTCGRPVPSLWLFISVHGTDGRDTQRELVPPELTGCQEYTFEQESAKGKISMVESG